MEEATGQKNSVWKVTKDVAGDIETIVEDKRCLDEDCKEEANGRSDWRTLEDKRSIAEDHTPKKKKKKMERRTEDQKKDKRRLSDNSGEETNGEGNKRT